MSLAPGGSLPGQSGDACSLAEKLGGHSANSRGRGPGSPKYPKLHNRPTLHSSTDFYNLLKLLKNIAQDEPRV